MTLRVCGLNVEARTPFGWSRVVDDFTLEVKAGQSVAIVGESGSGKSVAMLAVLGLLDPSKLRVVAGNVEFSGVGDLLTLGPRSRRKLLGARIGFVSQDPMEALNPVKRVGSQVAETITTHGSHITRRDAQRRTLDLLAAVEIRDPQRVSRQYPHELSGGMRQRVAIAIAIANGPELLIADEPTTALDATVQEAVLQLLRSAQHESGSSLAVITHDFGVVSAVADELTVMYAGTVVESGRLSDIVAQPLHPYTRMLLDCVPDPEARDAQLRYIPGLPPRPGNWPTGCRFHSRCDVSAGRSQCRDKLPNSFGYPSASPERLVACHFAAGRALDDRTAAR